MYSDKLKGEHKLERIGVSGLPVFPYGGGYLGVMVNGKRVAEHRYIMELELGRPLTGDEVVHHIDHNKWNNDPYNLCLTNRLEHNRYHARAYKYRNCMHLCPHKLVDTRDKKGKGLYVNRKKKAN
jgi:hypothetical protein